MTPRPAFQGPARPGLEDLRVHLLLLPRHLLHQLLFLQHQFPLLLVPPLRAQTSWWRCCRAFTRVNTWWCWVYIVWLSISQLWAWRSFLCRWPGQESGLLLMEEVRPLQLRSLSQIRRLHLLLRRMIQRPLPQSHLYQKLIQKQIQWLRRPVHKHHQYLHQCWSWEPPQGSPAGTPVLHLTDDEAMDQDPPQDQWQDFVSIFLSFEHF